MVLAVQDRGLAQGTGMKGWCQRKAVLLKFTIEGLLLVFEDCVTQLCRAESGFLGAAGHSDLSLASQARGQWGPGWGEPMALCTCRDISPCLDSLFLQI